jgi:Protein of unknown function (DUF3662)/FHA domain
VGVFDRVERGLERAVHGVFAKAFKSEVQPVEIASAMRRAMDDRATTIGHGRTFVPNLFTIELAPTDFERLTSYSDMLTDELVASAQEHAESQRYQPGGPIQVSFLSTEDLETGVFRVRPATAKAANAAAPPTPAFGPRAAPAVSAADVASASGTAGPPSPVARHEPAARPRSHPAQRPWLDVDGDHYPLLAAITVLGRDNTADVILDDPGISRQHTEIRVTSDGPHLITNIRDLGSTNGTFVNGERITSQRLTDGDRVSVGRTKMIFRAERR